MSELKCGAENCVYNRERLCSKGEICVGGKHAQICNDTCCENFLARREGTESVVSSISHPSEHISIDCEAQKCIYNVHFKCVAEHVDISGAGAREHEETSCRTFRER